MLSENIVLLRVNARVYNTYSTLYKMVHNICILINCWVPITIPGVNIKDRCCRITENTAKLCLELTYLIKDTLSEVLYFVYNKWNLWALFFFTKKDFWKMQQDQMISNYHAHCREVPLYIDKQICKHICKIPNCFCV